jgi:hypothetical protein
VTSKANYMIAEIDPNKFDSWSRRCGIQNLC